MRLLITRAIEDARKLADAVRARGHEPVLAPLIEIHDRAGVALPLADSAALLFTSANGVKAFVRRSARRDIPAFAVGPATAAAAKAAGFARVDVAEGDVEALAALVRRELRPEAGALVHVSGSDVAGDLVGALAPSGYRVHRAVIYEAAARKELLEEVGADFRAGWIDGVLLFSPRTAQIFVDLVGKAGLVSWMRPVIAFCLAERVAAVLQPLSFAQIRVASRADEAALVDLLA